MVDGFTVAAIILVAILFVIDYCIYRLCDTPSLKDSGWIEVRREGPFIVYRKQPWYSTKPLELYVLREEGESLYFPANKEEK